LKDHRERSIKNWEHFYKLEYLRNGSNEIMSIAKFVLELFAYSYNKIIFRKIELILTKGMDF